MVLNTGMPTIGGLAPAQEESAFFYPSEGASVESRNMTGYLRELRNTVCLPESCKLLAPWPDKMHSIKGLRDNNRSLIIQEYTAVIAERRYYLDVKGIGARTPMYGFTMPADNSFEWGSRFAGRGIEEHWKTMTSGNPHYTGEMWFGNGPYGAHGTRESLDSIAVTELCRDEKQPNCLNGFWICPVLYSTPLPEWVIHDGIKRYWYRKYSGGWSQQFRLVPGNIRLYFHSDCTLGVSPRKAFSIYGVETGDERDRFIENYIASGVAALTLAARTAHEVDGHFEVLDYDDVWLDKDSIIAPDGTLHFADIDDLEWRLYEDTIGVERKIRRQFERNFFEFMFGLDSIISETYLMDGKNNSPQQRREDIATRFEIALMIDTFAKVEISGSRADLIVNAPRVLDTPVGIRLMDFEIQG